MFRKRNLPSANGPPSSTEDPASASAKKKKPLPLSIAADEAAQEEDEVLVIDRSKTKSRSGGGPGGNSGGRAGMVFSTKDEESGARKHEDRSITTTAFGDRFVVSDANLEDEEARAQQEEYSQERLSMRRREMRELAEARQQQQDDKPKVEEGSSVGLPTIVSGEEAEKLMRRLARDDGDAIEADDGDVEEGPRPHTTSPVAESMAAKMATELRSLSPSSTSSSDWSNDERQTTGNSMASVSQKDATPVTVLEELEALYNRLKAREVELKHATLPATAIGFASEPVPSTVSGNDAQRQQSLAFASLRQRKVEELKRYAVTLVSCLKLKFHRLKDIALNQEDPATIERSMNLLWAEVNEEFSTMKGIVSKFAWWEEDDPAEFGRCVAKELGELLAPMLLGIFLIDPDAIPVQLSEDQWPFLAEALQIFHSDMVRRQVAARAVINALQAHPWRSEEMNDALERLTAQAATILSS